jgi:hypothetical protein
MSIVIALLAFVLWFVVAEVVKSTYAQAKDRRDERIMAAYLRQEEARFHAYNLAAIERAHHATVEEMVRIAAGASSDVIEGAAKEVTSNG